MWSITGVLDEVAEYVGELQRAAEFRCNTLARPRLLAEDPHRKPPDGNGHAVAVQIELVQARCTNVGLRVHFHAVDNREEIVALQAVEVHGLA